VTITIGVEECHQRVGLITGDADLDLTKSGIELVGVNLSVAIERVEVSEGSSETSNGLSTSGGDLSSYSFENYSSKA
jgi:hypothetical protein